MYPFSSITKILLVWTLKSILAISPQIEAQLVVSLFEQLDFDIIRIGIVWMIK